MFRDSTVGGNRNSTTLIHELSDKSSCLASVTVSFSRGSQLWLSESLQLGLPHHFPQPHSKHNGWSFYYFVLSVTENKTIQNTDICPGVTTHTNYSHAADCSLLHFKAFRPRNCYYWYQSTTLHSFMSAHLHLKTHIIYAALGLLFITINRHLSNGQLI